MEKTADKIQRELLVETAKPKEDIDTKKVQQLIFDFRNAVRTETIREVEKLYSETRNIGENHE